MNTADNFILYRRIYRMRKQKFKPTAIATALGIPIATVYKVLRQFGHHEQELHPHGKAMHHKSDTAYIVPLDRPQYLVLDLGGQLTFRHMKPLKEEFQKVVDSSDTRPVALRLAEVEAADSSGIGLMMNFHMQMQKKGRTVLLLDPNKNIDSVLRQLSIYNTLPVFGTELALEEKIKDFLPKADDRSRRGRIKF